MAEIQQQQILPAPFIEALGKTYGDQLTSAIGGLKGGDLSKIFGSQFVAGQDPLQIQAQKLMESGIGGYQKYLNAAEASTGPNAYKQFMSPYQQDVIDSSLAQFDIQAQKGLPMLAAQAIGAGAYGGGREGVQRAEYQSQSDLNRASLLAQLQQQGFGQAQQLAGQQYNQQLGLAGQTQGLLGSQISGLSALGQQQQAQRQAELEAEKQLEFQKIYQPLQTAQQYGAGIQPLIAGYPGREQTSVTPSPTALQTGLGTLSTLAGIYKTFNPSPITFINK